MASTIITKNKASGAPSSLVAGELAINTDNGSLYYGSTDANTGTSVSSSFTFGALTGSIIKGTTSLQTPLIEFTDGDDAIVIADGGGVTIADLTATTADINGGTIDGATIATSDIIVGADKTLDVRGGTVIFSADAISGDAVDGGTIGSTTITTLATAAINASTDIDIGSHDLKAETLTSDVATGTAPLTVTSTTEVSNLKAATATLAATATAVTVTDNESTAEENVITFVAGAAGSGNVGLEADGNLTYNPSTGKVTATGFVGGVTGNADTSTKIANIDNANIVVLAGAQTLTGTKTLNSFKGTGGATVTNILDEDAMGSDSATSLATQQSIKAYVDARYTYQYLTFSFKAQNIPPDVWISPSQSGPEYYFWNNTHGAGQTQAASDAPSAVDIETTISVDYLDQTSGFIMPLASKFIGFYGNCKVNSTTPNTLRPVLGLFRAAEPSDGNVSDLTATAISFDSYDTAGGNVKNRFLKLENFPGTPVALTQGDIIFPAIGFDATASDSNADIWGSFTIVLSTLIP